MKLNRNLIVFAAFWGPVAALSWACGLEEECAPGDSACFSTAGELSPAAEAAQQAGRQKLLGTWTLTQQLPGMDGVGRPVSHGAATWTVEIFEVEALDRYGESPRVTWRGALRPGTICLVPTAELGEDGAACEEVPGLLGSCSAHTCNRREELELTGYYDTQSDLLEFESYVQGAMHFANPEQGYLNLSAYVDGDLYLAQGREENACEGGSFCDWRSSAAGLLAERFEPATGVRTRSFVRESEVYRRDGAVNEEQVEVMIDSAAPVEEKLLGDWAVRMTLGTLDAVERPFNLGYVDYTLEFFEVEPVGVVGQWTVRGGLKGRALCVAPDATAGPGSAACDLFEPAPIGTCDATTCTEQGEVAVEGIYDALRNRLTLDEERAGVYYLDPARGYVNVSLYVSTTDASLPIQTVEATPCAGSIWCDWRLRTAGAFSGEYSSDWPSDVLYFEMARP